MHFHPMENDGGSERGLKKRHDVMKLNSPWLFGCDAALKAELLSLL